MNTVDNQQSPTSPQDAIAEGASIDPADVAKFAAIAEAWWDTAGKFRPLHRLNPVRIRYIRDLAVSHFGRTPEAERPLGGLRLLDIGCGGGLLSEPLARLGAEVTGIDASARNIAIASQHARQSGLDIRYMPVAAEALAETGETFDIVLAMEVLEHVADLSVFMTATARLLKPNGLFFAATINRTAKSYALAIIGAEYILRWLPRGTHDWRKFLRPSELAAALRPHGLDILRLDGVIYRPLTGDFVRARDLGVNYMLAAAR